MKIHEFLSDSVASPLLLNTAQQPIDPALLQEGTAKVKPIPVLFMEAVSRRGGENQSRFNLTEKEKRLWHSNFIGVAAARSRGV